MISRELAESAKPTQLTDSRWTKYIQKLLDSNCCRGILIVLRCQICKLQIKYTRLTMALRQMLCVGEISHVCYPNKSKLFSSQLISNKFPKSVRNFKRIRNEGPRIQTEPNPSPFTNIPMSPDPLNARKLVKPLGFTVAFSSACFVGATIWQYENMRAHAIHMMRQPTGWFKKAQQNAYKVGSVRREINTWWNSLSQADRLFVPICALNVLVFLAWKVPRFQPTMMRYFCSNPASQVLCWPMLLSTFSHYSGFHIFANMYVLHSFSMGAVERLGKEQFLGLYLCAGVVSSLASYTYKIFAGQPGFSLGASGAIMAILAYVCTQFPDTQLGIIFVPYFRFSAESAIQSLVAFDTLGLIMRWKLFDHAAHLGGAACGIVWSYWGNEHVWKKREKLMDYWHSIRGAPQK